MAVVVSDIFIDILKLLLAVGIGTIVGIEREKSGKPVGIRTLSLVCSASALVVMMTMAYFPAETGKVIQGIITGIGFLGAGAIIAHGDHVKGLTTAASIWAISIIGVGIGMGEFILAGMAALLFYLILILGKFEHKILGMDDYVPPKKK